LAVAKYSFVFVTVTDKTSPCCLLVADDELL